jgi:hypothetical protein
VSREAISTPHRARVILSSCSSTRSSTPRPSSDHPLGDAVATFVRREDAERSVEEVRGNDPELASYLRIEERELEAGGRN